MSPQNRNRLIAISAIVRTYCLKPASGGFGHWDCIQEPGEAMEMCDLLNDQPTLIHSSEFPSGLKNISGLIHNEIGELYAYNERGEWVYCLVAPMDRPITIDRDFLDQLEQNNYFDSEETRTAWEQAFPHPLPVCMEESEWDRVAQETMAAICNR